jgi:hypothetical protein
MFLYSGRLPRKHKCLKKEQLEVRVNIRDALQETLNKQTLKEWLIDNAEDVIERSRPGFHEEEVDSTTVCVDGVNFLVRFTVGLKEKRVIEELISIGVDSYSENVISNKSFIPAQTTRSVSQSDVTEQINDALEFKGLDILIDKKIKERRYKLIEERQELYNKILVDSKNTKQPEWLNDIIHIEEAGHDLLTLTIIQPL